MHGYRDGPRRNGPAYPFDRNRRMAPLIEGYRPRNGGAERRSGRDTGSRIGLMQRPVQSPVRQQSPPLTHEP